MKTSHSILWNDGPKLQKLQNELNEAELAKVEDGKGKNVWYCIGYAISRNSAEAVAFHDCDIKTYDENILIKLLTEIFIWSSTLILYLLDLTHTTNPQSTSPNIIRILSAQVD